MTRTGTLLGTVGHLSPEQITGNAIDGRSDIYALGTVLYECVGGDPPFCGEAQAVVYRLVPSFHSRHALWARRSTRRSKKSSSCVWRRT